MLPGEPKYVGLMQQIAKNRVYFGKSLFCETNRAYVIFNSGVEITTIMAVTRSFARKNATFAAALLATAALALSPIVAPAFAAKSSKVAQSVSQNWLGTFTPAGVDSKLAAKFATASRDRDPRFPFTPAGIDTNHSRTMTVAARTDSPLTAGAVSIRNAISAADPGAGKVAHLAVTDYRLTASRGWQGFALPATPKLSKPSPMSELGKGGFRLDEQDKKQSKFSTDIKLGQNAAMAPPVRGSAAAGDYKLDVGGSFSISRKIDVTAGVRYASERDRVIPAADDRKDSEAVYVGTKIRF